MLEKVIRKLWLLFRMAWTAFFAGSTRAFYDGISPIYESTFLNHIVHVENIVALLASTFSWMEGFIVLDLGCGTGLLSKALSREGFRAIGMDISLQSLQIMQQSDQGVSLIHGDAKSIPFSGCSFQAIVCLGVWRHLPHPEIVLDEICRVLGEDGNFVLGYFPPKLGGLFHIPDNPLGRMLAWSYKKTVRWFGYDDLLDLDLEEQAWQAISNRFDQVHRIESGKHWHLILAHHPLPVCEQGTGIDGLFTADNAHIKLNRLYPQS